MANKYSYTPRHEFEKLKKRFGNNIGIQLTLNSFRTQIFELKKEVRMLKNEIKAVNKRHDKLRQRFKNNKI